MTDNNIGEEASDMENKVTENENDNLETNQNGKFHRIPPLATALLYWIQIPQKPLLLMECTMKCNQNKHSLHRKRRHLHTHTTIYMHVHVLMYIPQTLKLTYTFNEKWKRKRKNQENQWIEI